MKVIKDTIRELVDLNLNKQEKIYFEIINRNYKEGILYIRLQDSQFIKSLFINQEIEIRLHKGNGVFYFKSKINDIYENLNEIKISGPNKINRLVS